MKRWAKAITVPAAILAACPTIEPAPFGDLVQVYDARTGEWYDEPGDAVEVGDIYLSNGHVLKAIDGDVDVLGEASEDELANVFWDPTTPLRAPTGTDWVLVLGDGVDIGHRRLSDLELSSPDATVRFAFQGRVFDTTDADSSGNLEVRLSADVISRAANTFVRIAPEVIDANLVFADGAKETLTATPNHPFWVDAVRDYVPLGELEVGTVLRTYGGSEATVFGLTWSSRSEERGARGEVEVYDIEVPGLHNFFVRDRRSEAPGVLVHNSTLKPSAGLRPTRQNVSGPKVDRLADDMKQNGFDPAWPVQVDGEYVVDGHHRVMAADKAGVDIVTTAGGSVPAGVKADAPADFSEVNVLDVDYW